MVGTFETIFLFVYLITFVETSASDSSLKYKATDVAYYGVREETTSLKSDMQCCIYCSQSQCCEGVIFDEPTKTCKVLYGIKEVSTALVQEKAWILTTLPKPKFDKFLLSTGSSVAEIVDFDKKTSYPTELTYPLNVWYAFGGQITNEKMLFCGGGKWGPGDGQYEKCYHLDIYQMETGFIESQTPLSIPRFKGASVVIRGLGLWVLGGINTVSGVTTYFKTTELVTLSQNMAGPDLPDTWAKMCAVKVSDKTTFIGGGDYSGKDTSKTTYFYKMKSPENIFDGEWIQGPDMLLARSDLSCGLLTLNSKSYIVATGGMSSDGQQLNAVEILDLTANTWTVGNPLPDPVAWHILVAPENQNLRILNSKSIYEMECLTDHPIDCTWKRTNQKLLQNRSNSLAIPISLNICTEK